MHEHVGLLHAVATILRTVRRSYRASAARVTEVFSRPPYAASRHRTIPGRPRAKAAPDSGFDVSRVTMNLVTSARRRNPRRLASGRSGLGSPAWNRAESDGDEHEFFAARVIKELAHPGTIGSVAAVGRDLPSAPGPGIGGYVDLGALTDRTRTRSSARPAKTRGFSSLTTSGEAAGPSCRRREGKHRDVEPGLGGLSLEKERARIRRKGGRENHAFPCQRSAG